MSGVNEGSDIYNAGGGGGTPPIDVGMVAVKVGDTPAYLNAKLTAELGVIIDEMGTAPNNSLRVRGNYVAGNGIEFQVSEVPPQPITIHSKSQSKIKEEDTPEYLESKISAHSGVKRNEVVPGTGVYRYEFVGNYIAGAGIELVPGAGIEDPIEIKATIVPVTANFGVGSTSLANCRGAIPPPGVNNGGGAILATLVQNPASFVATQLGCIIKQIGAGLICMAVYDSSGVMLGRTDTFVPNTLGANLKPIAFGPTGSPLANFTLVGGSLYYFGIWANSAANGVQLYSVDAGVTFGPTPWLGWSRDNVGAIPSPLTGGGSESSQRFYMIAKA